MSGCNRGGGVLWSSTTKNPDVSAGLLAYPLAHLLAPLTHLLALLRLLQSLAPLRSFDCFLANSFPSSLESKLLDVSKSNCCEP